MQSEGLLYLLFFNFSYTQHQLRNGLITTTTERRTLSVKVKFMVKLIRKVKLYMHLFLKCFAMCVNKKTIIIANMLITFFFNAEHLSI